MRKLGYHISPGNFEKGQYKYETLQLCMHSPAKLELSKSYTEEEISIMRSSFSDKKVYVHLPYILNPYAKWEDRIGKLTYLYNKNWGMILSKLQWDCVIHAGKPGTFTYTKDVGKRNHVSPINRLLKGGEGFNVLIENVASKKSDNSLLIEDIIDVIRYLSNSRVGLCLDVCHAYAQGYDFSDLNVRQSIDSLIRPHLGLIHLNGVDSKTSLGSGRDRHEEFDESTSVAKIPIDVYKWLDSFDVPMIFERGDSKDKKITVQDIESEIQRFESQILK